MDHWVGKVAVVTGASTGIGAGIAESLVKEGLIVIGLARRLDKLEELSSALSEAKGKFYPKKCDVTKKEDLLGVFGWIKTELGGVDVLVNNAGIYSYKPAIEDDIESLERILNVNVLASAICIREAVASMRERKFDGHIININSVNGHWIPHNEHSSIYTPSKFAITGLTEVVRKELVTSGSKIKITSVSPGIVETDIVNATGLPDSENYFNTVPHLKPIDIANAVLYILGTPANVQITELTIRPVGELM